MRIAIPLICLALTGCMTTEDPKPADWTAPAATPAKPAAADTPTASPQATTPARRPAQAARGAAQPPAPAPEPVTNPDQLLEIRQTCWAQVDRNRALKSLEARADWVGKCIADKTKAPAAQ